MKAEFRTLIKTPNAVTKISYSANKIITLCNLASLGVNININDLTTQEAYYMNYFGTKRMQKEERDKFETLFKNLSKMLGGK